MSDEEGLNLSDASGGPDLDLDIQDLDSGDESDAKPEPGTGIVEDPELKLDHMDRKVWLVKIPKFLAEAWNKVDADGEELGRVRIYKTPLPTANTRRKPEMRIDLLVPEDKPWAADLPKRYQLRFMNTSPMNEFVFTEGKATAHVNRPVVSFTQRGHSLRHMPYFATQAFEIAGTIQHEANVSAIIDNEYRKIMQSRNAAYAVPKRTLMPMDEGAKGNATYVSSAPRDNATFATLAQPALSGLSTKKGGQEKRERLPREELLLMLFTAFKKYNYWTLKALIDKTQQPSGWLREVLQDITVLNKRGPYTGMYQLKPEYRDRAADLAKMNPTAAGEAVLAGASGASGPADDSIIGAPGTVAPRR